jgi:hypothetical protein
MTTEATEAPAPEAPPAAEQIEAHELPSQPTAGAKPDPKKAPAKKAPTRRSAKVDIKGGMTGMYATVGALVSAIPSGHVGGDPAAPTSTQAIGMSIMEQATTAAEAWEAAANANPKVREALEKMLAVSTYGALFAAHVPILIVAGVVTGVVPPQLAVMFEAASGGGAE